MWQAKITKIERDGMVVKVTIDYTDGVDTITEIVSEIDVERDIAGKLRELNEIETKINTIKSDFLKAVITIENDEPKIEKEVFSVEPIESIEPVDPK